MTLVERLQAAYRAHAACSRRHDLAGALLAKQRIAQIKLQIRQRREQRGSDATVRVRAVNKPADAWEMIVSGESVPSYRARVRIALCEKCGLPPGCPDCQAVHDVPQAAQRLS